MSMNLLARIGLKVGIGTAVAALAISAALPAQAVSSPGWRRVDTVHFGAASTYSQFSAVAALSSNLAWAVGGRGEGGGVPRAYRWTGNGWKASSLPTGLQGELNEISAPSANDVWAVSDQSGFIVHYNGSKWSTATKRFTGDGELTGVTAFSPTNVWVFGGPGASAGYGTWRYNGKTWTKGVRATKLGIEMASAVSPKNMWAIGAVAAGDDSVFHYTGTWTQAKASALSGLQFSDILAQTGTDVWATASLQANGFTSYLIHRSSSGWRRFAVPWPVSVGQLTTDGSGGFWLTAFGKAGAAWVLHRSAAGQWTRKLLVSSGFVTGVARMPGTTSVWATGSADTATGANAVIWADGPV